MQYAYDPSGRYQERARRQTVQMFAMLAGIVILFMLGLWVGRQYAAAQLKSYAKQTQAQQTQVQEMQEDLTALRAEAQAAQMRYEQLNIQMSSVYPADGPLRDLVDLTRKQLEAGLAPERLALVIRSARPPRNCVDPVTKRFVVMTPAYKGPDAQVAIAESGLRVTGRGMSAINAAGQPEAWFDTAKPVTLVFQTVDGRKETKQGVLPLQHVIVSGDREYRFTVAAGDKSFGRITFDSCEYP
ncbi:MAG: hypothetical protein V4621_06295 [Pseudomonadota bacterium]